MLKLAKLPDRTPVKITFAATPDLNQALHAYAELYRETYGEAEPVPELIPHMLERFLRSDPAFIKTQRTLGNTDKSAAGSLKRETSGARETTT
jgi:hypothetical protein